MIFYFFITCTAFSIESLPLLSATYKRRLRLYHQYHLSFSLTSFALLDSNCFFNSSISSCSFDTFCLCYIQLSCLSCFLKLLLFFFTSCFKFSISFSFCSSSSSCSGTFSLMVNSAKPTGVDMRLAALLVLGE